MFKKLKERAYVIIKEFIVNEQTTGTLQHTYEGSFTNKMQQGFFRETDSIFAQLSWYSEGQLNGN